MAAWIKGKDDMDGKPEQEPQPLGYQSAESRRRFLIAVLMAAGAAFLVNLLAMRAVVAAFVSPDQRRQLRTVLIDADSAVEWQGATWHVATALEDDTGLGSAGQPGRREIFRATDQGAESLFTLAAGDAWLVPRGDTLWVLNSESVATYDGKLMTHVPAAAPPGRFAQPFLYKGHIAVVAEENEDRAVYLLRDETWRREAPVHIGTPEFQRFIPGRMMVVMKEDAPYVFAAWDGSVYMHEGFPDETAAFPSDWRAVAKIGNVWNAGLLDNRLAFFHDVPTRSGFSTQLVGLRRKGDGWDAFMEKNLPWPPVGLGLWQGDGYVDLNLELLPWTLQTLRVNASGVVSERALGDLIPLRGVRGVLQVIRLLMMSATPLGLAWVLTHLIHRHRTGQFIFGDLKASFATPWQRGLAKAVDAAIAFGPFAIVFFWLMTLASGSPDVFAVRGVIVFGGMTGAVWLALSVVAFVVMEAFWGKTPGKWICRVTVVGPTLRAPGILRALVRNLLLLLDGFLNFTVGLMLMALGLHWQRLGDMAAGTVVVSDGSVETARAAEHMDATV